MSKIKVKGIKQLVDGSVQPISIGGVQDDGSDEVLNIGSDGTLLVKKGIKFPVVQIPSADPNTLDDYEEGTWVPSFTNLTIGNGTLFGHYTKSGNVVTVEFGFLFGSTSSISGSLDMTNLPFPSKTLNGNMFASVQGTILDVGAFFFDIVGIFPLISSNTKVDFIRRAGTMNVVNATSPMTWASGDTLAMSFTYLTAN